MNKKKFPVPIYLIRHGEAESSWDQDSDPGLSKKGKRQSLELTTSLKNYILEEKFTIISSPLRRALETAQPMLESNNLTFSINKIFSEIPSPGIELSDRKEWLRKIFTINKNELLEPQSDWLKNILTEISNIKKPTLIFSHFMVINVIVGEILKSKKLVIFNPDNCSVTKITSKNKELRIIERGREFTTTIN